MYDIKGVIVEVSGAIMYKNDNGKKYFKKYIIIKKRINYKTTLISFLVYDINLEKVSKFALNDRVIIQFYPTSNKAKGTEYYHTSLILRGITKNYTKAQIRKVCKTMDSNDMFGYNNQVVNDINSIKN